MRRASLLLVVVFAACSDYTGVTNATRPAETQDEFISRMLNGAFVLRDPIFLNHPTQPRWDGPVLQRAVLWFDLDASVASESTYVARWENGDVVRDSATGDPLVHAGVQLMALSLDGVPEATDPNQGGQGFHLWGHRQNPSSSGAGTAFGDSIVIHFEVHRAVGVRHDFGYRNSSYGPVNDLTTYIRER